MKRLSQVTFKPSATKPVITESIWIQNFPTSHTGTSILMQLFIGKDNKPVINTNKDGVKQYQVSIYGTDAYAYVPVNAMKALKALSLAKTINDKVWVNLPLVSTVPSMADFNSAPAYK